MRLLSIAVVIFAGTLLIAAGAMCEAFTRNGNLDYFAAAVGTLLAAGGALMFVIEWLTGFPTKSDHTQQASATDRPHSSETT